MIRVSQLFSEETRELLYAYSCGNLPCLLYSDVDGLMNPAFCLTELVCKCILGTVQRVACGRCKSPAVDVAHSRVAGTHFVASNKESETSPGLADEGL